MKVLITGAKGFLGRHFASYLAKNFDAEVFGIGHGFWSCEDYSQWGLLGWLQADISSDGLGAIKDKYGRPDFIFHFAGGSSVGPSMSNPQGDFDKTAVSANILCEWVRLHSPSTKLVVSSSAAVYGDGHLNAIRENDELRPYSPYGFNKRISELVFESYAKNFGLDVVVVRFFSIYGENLRKQLLWDLCTKIKAGNPDILLGGSGDELRDWLHVSDACRLLRTLMNSAAKPFAVVNGGSGIPTSVKRISEMVSNAWGFNINIAFSGDIRLGDPRSLVSDVTYASSFGFNPIKDVSEGIFEYVKWYREEIK